MLRFFSKKRKFCFRSTMIGQPRLSYPKAACAFLKDSSVCKGSFFKYVGHILDLFDCEVFSMASDEGFKWRFHLHKDLIN